MFLSKQSLYWSFFATVSSLTGCGDAGDNVVRGSGGETNSGVGGGSNTGADGSGGGDNTGTGGNAQSGGTGSGGTSNPGTGGGTTVGSGGGPIIIIDPGGTGSAETQCDGLDNDADGIIDNVDVEGDGVCDCLKIATLGFTGGWGSGTNIFKDWLNARGAEPAVDLGNAVITEQLIQEFQVIVSLSVVIGGSKGAAAVHTYSDAEAAAMKNWIEVRGGGFMGTSGYTSKAAENVNVNKLISFSGLSYNATINSYVGGLITKWAAHPATEGMGTASITNGYEPIGAGTAIGFDSADRPVLKVIEVGGGRIALWADEWITYDNLWNNTADLDIELLWLNLLKYLSPPTECQVDIPDIY
jgi:hypothetical protein